MKLFTLYLAARCFMEMHLGISCLFLDFFSFAKTIMKIVKVCKEIYFSRKKLNFESVPKWPGHSRYFNDLFPAQRNLIHKHTKSLSSSKKKFYLTDFVELLDVDRTWKDLMIVLDPTFGFIYLLTVRKTECQNGCLVNIYL